MSAKTAKGWVVVDPDGSPIHRSVRPTKDAAIRSLARETDVELDGYRVLPCTITVTEEPTK